MPRSPEKYADIRGGVKTLFLLPSLECDIRIEIPDLCSKELISYIPAAVSAVKFLRLVRGLPLSEITVEAPVGEAVVLLEKDGKCSVILNRFTTLGAEKVSLLGEEINTMTLRSPFGKIRALSVNSAADFSAELLREATLSRQGEELIGAVAFDEKGSAVYHFSKSGELPKALTAAMTAASALKKKDASVKIDGDIFDFSCLNGKFKVSDRAGAPLTFYAPQI